MCYLLFSGSGWSRERARWSGAFTRGKSAFSFDFCLWKTSFSLLTWLARSAFYAERKRLLKFSDKRGKDWCSLSGSFICLTSCLTVELLWQPYVYFLFFFYFFLSFVHLVLLHPAILFCFSHEMFDYDLIWLFIIFIPDPCHFVFFFIFSFCVWTES